MPKKLKQKLKIEIEIKICNEWQSECKFGYSHSFESVLICK